MKVVLAEKLFWIQPRGVRDAVIDLVRSEAQDLDASIRSATIRPSGLLEIECTGNDAEILCEILKRRIGTVPRSISALDKWDSLKGFVSGVDDSGLWMEVCVDEEKQCFLHWEKAVVIAQLEDGQDIAPRQTADRYCLHRGFPLNLLVLHLDTKKSGGTCQLSDLQREEFLTWKRFPLDRVVVIAVTKRETINALEKAGLQRDIIQVQARSLSVQTLTCKIGTEAPGIIAKLGRFLPHARLYAFNSALKSEASFIGAPRSPVIADYLD